MDTVRKFTDDQLTLFGTVKLGALIDALEPLNTRERITDDAKDEPRWLLFDFGGLGPTTVDSYRGYYDHLALGFTERSSLPELPAILKNLKAAVGAEFSGWKGGDYRMNRDTPVWVANPGECDSTAIVGLLVESYRVTIVTEYIP